jgi:hypothetical protein
MPADSVHLSPSGRRRQPPGEQARRQPAAILLSRGHGRRDDGGPLHPRQTVQAASAAVAHPAPPAGPQHPRYPLQDRVPASPGGGVRPPAWPIRAQQQRQRGFKPYFFHAPEVERIGKGNAAAPYEFGVKVSIVTNNHRAPGRLFVLHARAMPDNPYDGHTLRDVIGRTETLTGCPIERAYADKRYCGHDAQIPVVSSCLARSGASSVSSSASSAASAQIGFLTDDFTGLTR